MENNNAKLWAISVMKIDEKVLNKILGSKTEQVIECSQIGFISDLERWFNSGIFINVLYIIKLREEKTNDHLSRYGKEFNKSKHRFLVFKRPYLISIDNYTLES